MNFNHELENEMAEQDRQARPYVVGECAYPGVIERFATEQEAAEYITASFPALDVLNGKYYIDGPEV